jgi:molybdopterin molybdotransferase
MNMKNERETSKNVFIDLDEAIGMLEALFEPLDAVSVPLGRAHGHVLAEDVVSREGHPPFSRSAMDGYAVRAQDAAAPGARLRLSGTVRAGGDGSGEIAPGTCIRIMTGAPLPAGADSVVIQEETREEGEDILFKRAARKGEHIRFAGEDVAAGGVACPRGALLTPPAVGTCAIAGASTLKVIRKPAVSVAVTGDEITEPGDPEPPYGTIRNSNGPVLLSLLEEMGIEGRYLGIVPDDPEKLEAAFEKGLRSDLLLVTGGVSVGQFDYVPRVIEKLGLAYLYRKVRVKPGKPAHFAHGARGKVFGLPGNPVSVLTSFHLFVKPALRKMMGWKEARLEYEGRLASRVRCDPERKIILPCRRRFLGGAFELAPVKLNGSADLAAASRADSLAVIPEREGDLDAGEKVRFIIMGEQL